MCLSSEAQGGVGSAAFDVEGAWEGSGDAHTLEVEVFGRRLEAVLSAETEPMPDTYSGSGAAGVVSRAGSVVVHSVS